MSRKKNSKPGRAIDTAYTAGEMVSVAGAVVRVRWRRVGLETHVRTHPAGDDEACWAELVGRPGGLRATPAEYEAASYQAIERAEVHFSCIDVNESEVRQYFVDRYFIESVTPQVAEPGIGLVVITCFHRHRPHKRNHVPREHLAPLEPRIWQLLHDLDNDRAGERKKKLVIHKGNTR
jgi:hypothetical protein